MLTDQETQTGTDLYRVLNVDPGADAEVIRAAYRALARRDHPDVSADPAASSKMAELNAAFEVLGDAERRAVYDQSRRALAATTDTPPGRPVARPPRGPPQAQQSIANRSVHAPRRRASPAPSWSSDVMPVGRSPIWPATTRITSSGSRAR
jgi:curved DNA-binding protein CbpA